MKDIKKPGIAKNEAGFGRSGFVFSSICKAPASRSKSAHGLHYAKPGTCLDNSATTPSTKKITAEVM